LISTKTAFFVEILMIFYPYKKAKKPVVNVKSNDVHKAISNRCVDRADEWSAAVSCSIETGFDLENVTSNYHTNCFTNFHREEWGYLDQFLFFSCRAFPNNLICKINVLLYLSHFFLSPVFFILF
jgi:hypothetical protein